MTLTNKAAIVAEYGAKRDTMRGITTANVTTTLGGLDAFGIQCDELVQVLGAREALEARTTNAAALATLTAKAAAVKNAAALVRTLVAEIQAVTPD
jgi:hypothetical protein